MEAVYTGSHQEQGICITLSEINYFFKVKSYFFNSSVQKRLPSANAKKQNDS